MASAIFTSSSSGTGVRGSLTNSYDGAYVAAGVVVGSTDNDAIVGLQSYHYVTVVGTVIGDGSGIVLGDDSSADTNARVVVRTGAEVYGFDFYGIKILAANSTVTSAGYVYGDVAGVFVQGTVASSTSTITNTGQIEGRSNGVQHSSNSTDILMVKNSGTISGDFSFRDSSISGSVDKITNSGTMIGDIDLSAGDDLYDGRSGQVQGDIFGGAGADLIYGGTEANVIEGGVGNDTMNGGLGSDSFVYRTIGDSTVATTGRDYIRDFNRAQGDRIDLSLIDANTSASAAGDQAFAFIGTAAFGGQAGQLRAIDAGKYTIVYGDVNGDAVADFGITVNKTVFAAGDFVL